MAGHFSVNGVTIKNPTTFKISRYKVTDMDRLADSTMEGDLLGKKTKFFFTYEAITSEELNAILDAIWEVNELFFPLVYTDDNGVEQTKTVYVGEIPSELHRAYGSYWVWKGVTFNLIEK